jgi:hypothetical protein
MARFSKATGIWTTTAVKVAKPYLYIPVMCKDIVQAHIDSQEPLHTARVLGPEDPRHIQKRFTNVPRPSTDEIAKQKAIKSRKIP